MRVLIFLTGFWAFVAALVGWVFLCQAFITQPYGTIICLTPIAVGVSVLLGFAARDCL